MRTFETFPNLVTMFFTRARENGDTPFLWHKGGNGWQSRSWAQTAREVASLAAALKKKNYARAFGEKFEVALSPAVKWEFMDKKKVLDILKTAGLFEKVLAPSAPLVGPPGSALAAAFDDLLGALEALHQVGVV